MYVCKNNNNNKLQQQQQLDYNKNSKINRVPYKRYKSNVFITEVKTNKSACCSAARFHFEKIRLAALGITQETWLSNT